MWVDIYNRIIGLLGFCFYFKYRKIIIIISIIYK
nr:MAG TPA: hypothetical protein [Caudoviricetes sp.]